MTADDEGIFGAPPRKSPSHEIGQNLDDLSIHQIEERIAALEAEIVRLREARKAKQASLVRRRGVFQDLNFLPGDLRGPASRAGLLLQVIVI